MRRILVLVLAPLLLLGLPAAPASAAYDALPVGTQVDYQLGGARWMPSSVGILVRDRHDAPLAHRYNVCYVNGFQTQADESAFWRRHADLVLHRDGKPVVDSAWNEWLLDLRTRDKRTRLAAIVGAWTRGCAAHGYDAVELDNLDSFTRSGGLLTQGQATTYARLLVRAAHDAGLAAGQKNLGEWDGRTAGYDFAIAEECGRYRECGSYTAHYGRRVLAIEYRSTDFRWTCAHYGPQLAVELRDLDLSPSGTHHWC